jgi:hypothetical protein
MDAMILTILAFSQDGAGVIRGKEKLDILIIPCIAFTYPVHTPYQHGPKQNAAYLQQHKKINLCCAT